MQKGMKNRISGWVRLLENAITFSALSILLFSVLLGVLTRYVTESPAVWTTELSGILFTWVVFIGAMMAYRDGKHIRITLLVDKMPSRARRTVLFAGDVIVIGFLSYTAILSVKMMMLGATRLSPVMRIPFSWVYLATVIAFSAMALSAVMRLAGVISGSEPGQDPEQTP
jgi:TRAP-type C4-dicarboxylate transport system permease small subunit